jgi:signal peptidase I
VEGSVRRLALLLALAASAALLLRAFVAETLAVEGGAMAPTLLAGDRVLVWKGAYGLRIPLGGWRPFGGTPPGRGDLVALGSPAGAGRGRVLRVVGLPGDVVELREQVLLVNGVPQPREPLGERAYEERNEETGIWWTDSCRLLRERLAAGPLPRPASAMPVDAEGAFREGARAGVRAHEILQCRRARPGGGEGPFEVVKPGHVLLLGDNRDRAGDGRGEGRGQVPLSRIEGRVVGVAWYSGGSGAAGVAARPGRFERLFKRVE